MNYLKNYLTVGRFKIEEVLPFITNDKRSKKIFTVFDRDYLVSMDSLRYKVFAKGLHCSKCNIAGSFFLLQKSISDPGDLYHFNLFAWDELKNKPILMTKDHIVPKAKGGRDHLNNLQTMCEICNRKKGNQ